MTDTDPEAFYDRYGEREWERLDRDLFHRLEFERTTDRLAATLPPADGDDPPTVLDVGGGAGRYAVWLAERGYEVAVVEPSETQRTLAREQAAERGLDDRVTVRDGDVRDLAVDDDAVAATCCLGGPLSHVLDAGERAAAAAELRRVTARGVPVFVSVMGLVGTALVAVAGAGRGGADLLPAVPAIVREGEFTGALAERAGVEPSMADCHFFRREELVDLLARAGLTVERVVGLEGVAAARRTDFDAIDDGDREAIRETNDLLGTDPTLADLSPHLLAVCRAPGV